MLNTYLNNTQELLSNPAAPTTLYTTSDLTGYINTARMQLAGESKCIRNLVNVSVTSVTSIYPFASFTGFASGVDAVYEINQLSRVAGTGFVYMGSRGWPWATLYWRNSAAPTPGAPTEWAQYKVGQTGSIMVNPIPDQNYTLQADAVCVPVALADDTTPEAIPYPYTDAVPYFAAYYAYMSSQRQQDAQQMYGRYQEFLNRARMISVPHVLPSQYDQAIDAGPPKQGGK